MSTLHIVNKTGQPLSLCLRSTGPNDAIIFIEDGVYNLPEILLKSIHINQPVFALKDDCSARGLDIGDSSVDCISMDQFVALTEKHTKTLSWF